VNTGDTITAISSAVGPAARMIVRLSGPSAFPLATGFCDAVPPHAAAARATLRLRGMAVPVTLYAFRSPHSYTGEDLLEFHLPGNPLLCRRLIDDLLAAGARPAEAGEFTARAYFNGKIDLTAAEGVAATIAAHGEAELRAARQLLAGELARRLRPAMDVLADTLALVEVGIDFVEEDVTFLSAGEVSDRITRVEQMLREIVDQSARFEKLSHEPRVVLVGRPNAGKSTLLNALAGRERAVVSPVAGTTRDAISAEVCLRRGMIHLIDVAGLEHEATTGNGPQAEIDRQIQARAKAELESADRVVLVQDSTSSDEPPALSRSPDLVVHTKADLRPGPGEVSVSALTGQGMAELKRRLDELAFGSEAGTATLALNARHLKAIAEARGALARATDAIARGPELLALDLRDALDALGRVLGSVTPDDLLGRIFSAFCIGK
jgi:tRNA modification GTPase